MIAMMVIIIILSCRIGHGGLLNHNLGIVVAAKTDMIRLDANQIYRKNPTMIVMMVMIIIPSCRIGQRGLNNHSLDSVVTSKTDMVRLDETPIYNETPTMIVMMIVMTVMIIIPSCKIGHSSTSGIRDNEYEIRWFQWFRWWWSWWLRWLSYNVVCSSKPDFSSPSLEILPLKKIWLYFTWIMWLRTERE